MNSKSFTVGLLLTQSCILAQGQWLGLAPVVTREDIADGQNLHFDVQINDLGQALYMISEPGGPNHSINPDIDRVFVDDKLVFETRSGVNGFSSLRTELGNITNSGQFALYSGRNYYRGDTNGTIEIIQECCDIQSVYMGDGGVWVTKPKIDAEGNVFYIGSTMEQMPRDQPNYNGVASIYKGSDADVVFSDLRLWEFVSEVRHANTAWDINDSGDLVIDNFFVPAGESVVGALSGFAASSQTSLNNHGESTRFGERRTPTGGFEPVIAINGGEEPELFVVEGLVERAFINDLRQVFYQTGSFFRDTATLSMLDATTGVTADLIAVEDLELFQFGFRLYDVNNAGQIALGLRKGLYLGTISDAPVPDLNFDAQTTAADIDRLLTQIRSGTERSYFDLNQDGVVSSLDADFWIEELVGSRSGDINLDKVVGFADFLILSQNFGTTNQGWAAGDFDGSGETAFSDFLALSENFGFDNQVAVSIPEPRNSFNVLLLIFLIIRNRKREYEHES